MIITLTEPAAQALRWSNALASPGRLAIGPSIVPCRADKRPLRGWLWGDECVPGYEQPVGRVLTALREGQSRNENYRARTFAILPASDGLVVLDVDNMDYLPRAIEAFGPTPVYMRSRSGKVHLYYRGPAVPSHSGLWGKTTVEVKSAGAMIHVAGPGYVPSVELPAAVTAENRGWLRSHLPVFNVDTYKTLVDLLAAPEYDEPDDGPPRYATSPEEVERLWRYAEKRDAARTGNQGHKHTRGLALLLGDHGAREELALEIVREWNRTCEPPWSDGEIEKKVREAYKTRKHRIGWRMRDDVDEPTGDGDGDCYTEAEYRQMIADAVAAGDAHEADVLRFECYVYHLVMVA